MPAKLLTELRLLLRKRQVPVSMSAASNAPRGSTHAVACRLVLDDPVALLRLAAIVGEAQQVKRPHRFGRFSATVICPGARRPKRHEPRLGGVDRQSITAKPFWNDFQNALSITTVAKSDHEIIRVTDEEGTVSQTRFHIAFDPQIQHVVQEDVREQR